MAAGDEQLLTFHEASSMALPSDLRARLTLPAFAAPMFLCSGPELAIACCEAGIVGSLTRNHCRDLEELTAQLATVTKALARFADTHPGRIVGPLAVNISPTFSQDEFRAHLAACLGLRHGRDDMSLIAHHANVYQLGYVARDVGAAVDFLGNKYGATSVDLKDHDLTVTRDRRPMSLQMRVAIVNMGHMQIEVIEPVGGEAASIYTDDIDFAASPIVFHHVGIAVPGAIANWSAMEADVAAADEDFAMAFAFDHAGEAMVRFAYVDTRRYTGHYTEFLWWSPAVAFGNAAFPDRQREAAA